MTDINSVIYEQNSSAVAYQRSSVCVPVSVKPYVTVGKPVTRCCGMPCVTPGKKTCDGVKNGECVFTVSQNICVEVPVAFGAAASAGDTYVNCICAAANDIGFEGNMEEK